MNANYELFPMLQTNLTNYTLYISSTHARLSVCMFVCVESVSNCYGGWWINYYDHMNLDSSFNDRHVELGKSGWTASAELAPR